MPEIFLSYNREDETRAKLFADAFKAQAFKARWDEGLRTGEAYDEVTETALRTAKSADSLSAFQSTTADVLSKIVSYSKRHSRPPRPEVGRF